MITQPSPLQQSVGAFSGPSVRNIASSQHTQPSQPANERPQDKTEEAATAVISRLSPAELQMVSELEARDREVRAHEQAHITAGGGHVQGGARFTYQKGPDGRLYAIGGEVSIDMSAVSGDPEATIQKMDQVRQAALAPASPSAQDRAVAAQAGQIKSQAVQELVQLTQKAQALETAKRMTPSEASERYTTEPGAIPAGNRLDVIA